MGYYKRYIDRLTKTSCKKYDWATNVAQSNIIILIDEYIDTIKNKNANGMELTEGEKKFEQTMKLFENDEDYINHVKEREGEINMTYSNTTAVATTKETTKGTTISKGTTASTSKWSTSYDYGYDYGYGTGYTSYYVPPVGFHYHGRKNETILPDFIDICKMSQEKLKRFLVRKLREYYNKEDIYARDGFLFATGDIPVMLTAHMDTVHDEPIKDYYEWTETQKKKDKKEYDVHVLSSPQGIGGDDRCGIWAILQILSLGYKPYILFNEDEEIGCVGAKKFCKNNDLVEKCIDKGIKFIVEMDRKNQHDLVFYSCDNREFIYWCEEVTGWLENFGSCSDISYLAPEIGCAAVNLSCGYYDEHRTWHTVIIEEMFNTMATCIKLIEASEKVEIFEYVEKKSYYNSKYYSKYSYYDDDDDDYDYYDYKGRKITSKTSTSYRTCAVEFEYVIYISEEDDYQTRYITEKGKTFDECYANFFKNHPTICWRDILNYDEYYLNY